MLREPLLYSSPYEGAGRGPPAVQEGRAECLERAANAVQLRSRLGDA